MVQDLSKRDALSLVNWIEESTKAANKVIMMRPMFFSLLDTGIFADLKVYTFLAVIRLSDSA